MKDPRVGFKNTPGSETRPGSSTSVSLSKQEKGNLEKPGLLKPGKPTYCQVPAARIPPPRQAHHREAHHAMSRVPGSRTRVGIAVPVTDVGGVVPCVICSARARAVRES